MGALNVEAQFLGFGFVVGPAAPAIGAFRTRLLFHPDRGAHTVVLQEVARERFCNVAPEKTETQKKGCNSDS